MDLNIVWFLLIGILIAGYSILDGFDLGVGILYLFAKDEEERRLHLNAIGPVWDGNEVWLLTAGGALFAAFPIVYATVFSSFYLAFVLLLVALIFRAISFEFRGKVTSRPWKRFWDWAFGLGSLLPAILLGVAVGNILQGVPMAEPGLFTGSFLGLLNPFALLVGGLSLALFLLQGSLYLSLKTGGALKHRLTKWATGSWISVILLFLAATLGAFFAAPYLFKNYVTHPYLWALLLLLLLTTLYVPVALRSGRFLQAFCASSAAIFFMVGVMGASLFPRLLPSHPDLAHSLTIYNGASSPRTLAVMLIIALVGMPIVLAYTAFVYRVFKGKVELTEEGY